MRLTQTDELQIGIYDILGSNLDNVNNDLLNDVIVHAHHYLHVRFENVWSLVEIAKKRLLEL